MSHQSQTRQTDVLLIGAGIMSATLGVMLRELDPSLSIEVHEVLAKEAQESSNAWNNAGTGHAALCEMNYTPELPDGSIDIAEAVEVNTWFDLSCELWSYLTTKGLIANPQDFIHPVPHHSFVTGEANIAYLKKRFEALTAHHCFQGMQYSEDKSQIQEWAPLLMAGRDPNEKVAITRMMTGTDVNYGALTKILLDAAKSSGGFDVHFNSKIKALKKVGDRWEVHAKNVNTHAHEVICAKFVFIGAGGAALPLLQHSKIPEAEGFAGFPVSGIWLRCDKESIAESHNAKVYGKASVGSPPMSVPHLDRRHIDGKISLLFGPFAGFSTKFLKHGSYLDFFRSMDLHNLIPMLAVGKDDLQLTEYLVGQVLESHEERIAELRKFYPEVQDDDWRLQVAGQRVQIIKKDPVHHGVLQFGTELVKSQDGSIIALLGASPGASTAVSIMLHVLEACFADRLKESEFKNKLLAMIPSYGRSLKDDASLCQKVRHQYADVLNTHMI